MATMRGIGVEGARTYIIENQGTFNSNDIGGDEVGVWELIGDGKEAVMGTNWLHVFDHKAGVYFFVNFPVEKWFELHTLLCGYPY